MLYGRLGGLLERSSTLARCHHGMGPGFLPESKAQERVQRPGVSDADSSVHRVAAGRLSVASPILCEAYVKSDTNYERRMLAKFKGHINLIAQNQYIHRGTL